MTLLSELTPKTEVSWTSYSGLTMHRSCPQAWTFRQLYRLVKPPEDDAKVELKFGTWWHALRAAEAIERGRRLGSIKFVPKTIKCSDEGPEIPTRLHINDDCTSERCKDDSHWRDVENLQERVLHAAEQWEERLPEDHADLWQSKLGSNSVSKLLRDLDARYQRVHADDVKNEEPIGVEVKWTRPLPGFPETVLLGYTDEVYRDLKRGMVVVRDHKTAKQLGAMNATDDLKNSQLHLNAWGLADRIKEWGVEKVQAISFERVNSVRPTKPKLTQAGKLSKQVTNFDLPTYLAFCESEEAIAKGYKPEEAQIERISSPAYETKWFQRTLRPINRNIAQAHLQAAVDSMGDTKVTIDRVGRRGFATRNFTGSACNYCDFAKLCIATMVGGPGGEYHIEEYGLRLMGQK